MLRKLFVIGLMAIATAGVNAAEIQRRGTDTFGLGDWPSSKNFDTPPGGMHDFLSRLSYPNELRRQRVRGVMQVHVSLDANGRLVAARILRPVHPVLDHMVLDAVRE